MIAISTLFTFAIAIFALVAGSVSKVDKAIGCGSEYTGVLKIYDGVDAYMQEIDTTFCSNSCPCQFTNNTGYVNNATIVGYYNQWSKSTPGATRFQNCSDIVKNNTYAAFQQRVNDTTFDSNLFYDYFEQIETKFNCTGLCQTTYNNRLTNTQMQMYKYLFTDVNRYFRIF